MRRDCALVHETEHRAAFRRGDRAALGRVYADHAGRLAAFLRRTSRGRANADVMDLVHETFLRAFADGARLRYDGVRPYWLYLRAIARNLLVDAAVRRARTAPADPALDPRGEPVPIALVENEIAELLSDFYDGLSEPLRDVWRLRFEAGHPQHLAASLLGMTRVQLRRREARLRRDVLAHLRGAGYLAVHHFADFRLALEGEVEWNAPFPDTGDCLRASA